MDIEQIIAKAGGTEALAALTGIGTEAIRKWRQSRSIPGKHWAALLRVPGITLSDLNPDTRPKKVTNVCDACPDGATAVLVLADGTVHWGVGFGAHTGSGSFVDAVSAHNVSGTDGSDASLPFNAAIGELCFNTGMTGYQETLTDPSFAGQIVTFTFPHIGNVGTNSDDDEAEHVAARGVVVKEDITLPANWRSTLKLAQWMSDRNLPGISGIDTRLITRRLRDGGPQTAVLAFPENRLFDLAALRQQAQAWPGLEGMDLARTVTCSASSSWTQGVWQKQATQRTVRRRVVAVDYGAKRNILRCLVTAGCDVTLVPATTSAEEILRHKPEGVFLSNGPGDPAATGVYAVPTIKSILDANIPVFGICLGHQLLAQALGAKTFKLDRGHRGANQPVKDLASGRVEITSQNHGFAVDDASLPNDVIATHISLFDGSNEGIRSTRYNAFSVQYHPEACPGPSDSSYLFERFVTLMDERAA